MKETLESYKIIRLTASNVKRLEAVEIEPTGNVVVIGGNNGAGKSSVLDAILYGLVGKKAMPAMPLREGSEKSEIEIDLGEFKIIRTIRENKTQSVKIVTPEGAGFTSPQAKLDAIVSELSFDPVQFMNSPTKSQAVTLKSILNLDFTDLDRKRDSLFSERTEMNRDAKRCKGTLESMSFDKALGTERIDVSALLDKQDRAMNVHEQYNIRKRELENCEQLFNSLQKEKEELLKRLSELDEATNKAKSSLQNLKAGLGDITHQNMESIREEIREAQQKNQVISDNIRYKAVEDEMEVHENKSESLTTEIQKIDNQKSEAMQNASFPVDGLSFSDDGVEYKGFPLDQASSAEQLRICAAIGVALNPQLRFITIRDGSLLDENSMKVISEFAEENDVQVWIERVGEGDAGAIIIEEGKVKK